MHVTCTITVILITCINSDLCHGLPWLGDFELLDEELLMEFIEHIEDFRDPSDDGLVGGV